MKFPAPERAAPDRAVPAVTDHPGGAPVITAPDVMCGTLPPAAGRAAGGFLQRSA